ncbi:molybdopterin-guanine dinucleotide biosynthesis protein B [Alphaproteobacteria bacterium LSUCC0684]
MTPLPNASRHSMVFGLAGFSGSGKTTLAEKLIRILTQRGYSVASIKHAHHAFDPDTPGKDSWRHRKAGATQMLISSSLRRVHFIETPDRDEADLNTLLGELMPTDIVLVEGFKDTDFPKIEVWRAETGNAFLYPERPGIFAVAADTPLPDCPLPVLDLNDAATIADTLIKGFD